MSQAKIRVVLDQINMHEYQSALKTIEQLFSKEKNKASLKPEESQWLRLLQGVCLSKLTFYGEATQIFLDFASQKCLVDIQERDIQQILETIAQPLGFVGKIREIVEQSMTEKNLGKDVNALKNLLIVSIKESNFDIAQKTASKLFTATKEIKYLISNVVFQFYAVNQLDEATQADKITQQISLIKLFLTKIYTGNGVDKNGIAGATDVNGAKQLVRFHYQLLAKEKKYDEMLDLLLVKYPSAFSDYLNHLDKLEELFEKNNSLYRTLVNANFAAFKVNSNMETFQMVYEKYDRFATFLFKQLTTNNVVSTLDSIDVTRDNVKGKLFEALEEGDDSIKVQHIEMYYASLESHKQLLKATQAKHPHFRNAMKCVIQAQFGVLSRMRILNRNANAVELNASAFLNSTVKSLIDDYVEYFACILTFPEEVFESLKNAPKDVQVYAVAKLDAVKESSAINRCIVLVNQYKLKIIFQQLAGVVAIADESTVYAHWADLIKYYVEYFKEIYPEAEAKAVEKGERLYVDDFIIIAADIAMEYVYRSKNGMSKETFKVLSRVVYLLECALKKSQYNYDIQMRLLLISILIGNRERVYDLLVIMDVKGVQFETLGFLYLSTALDLGFDMNSDANIQKSLQFFNENQRESKEVMYQGVKNSNFEIWDFKKYDDWIGRSYFKMMASYAKAQLLLKDQLKTGAASTNLDVNARYFHSLCLRRLNEAAEEKKNAQSKDAYGLVWNFDMRVIQSIFCNEDSVPNAQFYRNYLGLFNDSSYLKLNILGTQLLFGVKEILVKEFADEKQYADAIEQLKSVISETALIQENYRVENVTDLKQFSFYNKPEYLKKYETADDWQTNDIADRFHFEQASYAINTQIAAFLVEVIELAPKTTTEEMLAQLSEKLERLSVKIQAFVKVELADTYAKCDSEVFKLRFYKNLVRFNQGVCRFVEVLITSQEALKSRLQKLAKKNGDLKKEVTNFSKKYKTEVDALISVIVESLSAVQAKVESANTTMKDAVNATIREAVQEKVIGGAAKQSVFDLTSEFPNLKKDDIMVRFSDEIAVNYRYLSIVTVDLIKDALKIAKAAASK